MDACPMYVGLKSYLAHITSNDLLDHCSARGVTTIDGKSLTNCERRPIRAQKQNHVRDLLRLREPANRRVGEKKLAHLWIVEPMFRHRRLDQSRREGVDSNSLARIFDRGSFRQTNNCVFRGHVGTDAAL